MRFALTTAGLATVTLAGTATGATVDFTHDMDRWNGEHSWQVHAGSASGSIVASMYVNSLNQLAYYGASNLTSSQNTDADIWGSVSGTLDLANGTYHVAMQDAYNDGWAWGTYVGGLAIGSGSASFPSGSTASFSFSVVPAPGAMALLGLAGLATRRRRRD